MKQEFVSGSTTPTKDNPFGFVDVLKKEYEVFNKNLDAFMEKHADEFVLIKGDHIEGFYKDEREACDIGLEKYGHTGCFLVTKVTREEEEPIFVSPIAFGYNI